MCRCVSGEGGGGGFLTHEPQREETVSISLTSLRGATVAIRSSTGGICDVLAGCEGASH